VVGFTIGSRGKLPGKTCEKRRRGNNNNNNFTDKWLTNDQAVVTLALSK
jgi:hypothetical protein